MSDEIDLSTLTAEDLQILDHIAAEDRDGHSVPVWHSRRLVPFVDPGQPGKLLRNAFVQVPSLAPEDLAPVYAKLNEIDGSRRIIRDGKPQ